jgi:hypothetical protein
MKIEAISKSCSYFVLGDAEMVAARQGTVAQLLKFVEGRSTELG